MDWNNSHSSHRRKTGTSNAEWISGLLIFGAIFCATILIFYPSV